MKWGVVTRWLVALGFFAAQTLAVVHATQHELKPEKSAACEICAYAHAGGAAPAAVVAHGSIVPRGEEPVPEHVAAVLLRPIARPNSRGPPILPI